YRDHDRSRRDRARGVAVAAPRPRTGTFTAEGRAPPRVDFRRRRDDDLDRLADGGAADCGDWRDSQRRRQHRPRHRVAVDLYGLLRGAAGRGPDRPRGDAQPGYRRTVEDANAGRALGPDRAGGNHAAYGPGADLRRRPAPGRLALSLDLSYLTVF